MKAILFLATFWIGCVAFAAPTLESTVSIAPNMMFPTSVVNVTINGLAAEELFSAFEPIPTLPVFNTGREIRQFGSTVCTRQVTADEVRQASVVSYECVINVFTKSH